MDECIRHQLQDYCGSQLLWRAKHDVAYLQIHVTGLCENKCSFCYYQQRNGSKLYKKSLSLEEIKKIVNQFVKSTGKKKPVIELIGGDPLLHPQIFEILEHLKKTNADYGIKGNPHKLDHQTVKRLKMLGLGRYQLSLDGMQKTHDEIRGRKGLFLLTVWAIKMLLQSDIVPVIRYTLSSTNKEDLTKLQNYLHSNRLSCVLSVSRLIDHKNRDNMISLDQLITTYKKHILLFAKHISTCNDTYQLLFKDHLFVPLLHRMGLLTENTVNKLLLLPNTINCSMFRDVYIIDVDGSLRLCQKNPESMFGNYKNISFRDLFAKHDRFPFGCYTSHVCQGCYYKTICHGCPAYETAMGLNACPLHRKDRKAA